MTLVTQLSCFSGRPLRAIAPDLAQAITEEMSNHASRLLILLEAFLDLTDSTLELSEIDTPAGTERLHLFAGSIYSPLFHQSARAALGAFRRALGQMGFPHVFLGWRIVGPNGSLKPDSPIAEYRDAFNRLQFREEKILYWTGWHVTNLNGKVVCFRLHAMYARLGHRIATKFFSACESYFSARRSEAMIPVNRLDEFISGVKTPLTEADFQSRSWVGEFVREFMMFYFTGLLNNGGSLRTAIDSWSDFAAFLESSILGKVWANPYRAVPRPILRERKWDKTHIKIGSDGTALKAKLLTEVPLHISDSEAVELIWHRIQADVDTVDRWANAEADAVWGAYEKRISIAPLGIVSRQGPVGVNNGARARTSRSNPDYLAHAAATYQKLGHLTGADCSCGLSVMYPKHFGLLARELGIPDQLACAAYAVLIVREHPAFNPSVLQYLEIFDDKEQMTGFAPSEGGWRLTGYKRRKGEEKAQVTALVSPDLASRIKQLVSLTAPLRAYLRGKGDPHWKRLFLAASSVGARPRSPGLDDFTHIATKLESQLELRVGIDQEQASNLAARLSLARLRASCGVLIYFRTRSVQAMADALGHTAYDSRLLARYLPPILQEFFAERWVRLFQAGIICEALKDSPLLLRASGFVSQEELDEYLSTSTGLTSLARSPECAPVSQSDGARVVIGVSPEILRTLSALVATTECAQRPLSSAAAMWRELGGLILQNVERDPDLCCMLTEANKIRAPTFADEALYA